VPSGTTVLGLFANYKVDKFKDREIKTMNVWMHSQARKAMGDEDPISDGAKYPVLQVPNMLGMSVLYIGDPEIVQEFMTTKQQVIEKSKNF